MGFEDHGRRYRWDGGNGIEREREREGGMSASPRASRDRWGARSVERFERQEQVGEGTYGQVYRALDAETRELVALKKVRMDNEKKEGFPITAIREIKILKKLHHKNVVNLKEIVTSKGETSKYKGSIYMVFEYMDHDLTGLQDSHKGKFRVEEVKCLMKQLLEGLSYCHKQKILHRDIKGSNLLINKDGVLKLADFGLARPFPQETTDSRLTNRVITLWYRPPELLLGSEKYSYEVDMWSAGCIMAELLLGKPLLQGKTEIEQLELIFRLCGTPSEENWPGVSKLPFAHFIKKDRPYKPKLRETMRHLQDESCIKLLESLLCLNPRKRVDASSALRSEWFSTHPLPCQPGDLPKHKDSHEFTTKKRKAEERKGAAREMPNEAPKRPRADDQAAPPPPPSHYPSHPSGPRPPPGGREGTFGGTRPPPPYRNLAPSSREMPGPQTRPSLARPGEGGSNWLKEKR